MLTQNRENTRTLGTAYRNFSRKRYDQLKNQNQFLRQSDIVSKVIKEWESMNQTQKSKFFDEKMDTVLLNVQPLATPNKGNLGKSNQKTTTNKMMEQGSELNMEDIQVKEFDLSSHSAMKKSKKINKKPQTEYVSFLKFHFQKLREEHKKWSTHQISSIIRLLWKKKKNLSKSISSRTRSLKAISGRKFFMKLKKDMGMSVQKSMSMWKRMPRESRMMWNKKGDPSISQNIQMQMPMKMRFAPESQMNSNSMNFLKNKMM